MKFLSYDENSRDWNDRGVCVVNNFSTSARWIRRVLADGQPGTRRRVGRNCVISNTRKWNKFKENPHTNL